MSNIKSVIMCTCLLFGTVATSRAQGWRGIVPLHSSRTDVERLLGPPRERRGVASTYETQNERVLVFYSGEPCKKDENWNVPRDTVLTFTISPNSKILVSNLKLDSAQYKRKLDYHVQGIIYYFNREEGIRISARSVAGEDEFVVSISYEAALKDNYLLCPGVPPVTSSDIDGPPAHKFDEYSKILVSDENARLDNFAIYLQENPKLIGYIIAYAGRRARAGEAKARAQHAKNYLVKHRGVRADRLVTIDGGYRKDRMVELFTTIPGVPPNATPTLRPSEVKIIPNAKAKNGR